MTEDPKTLMRALERERKRRAVAESLLEEKSRELFHSFEELEQAHKQLKANQKQLVQSEKMASLGIMSAGVAHEINNPIGFVLSNLKTLAEYAPVFSNLYEGLNGLLEKIEDDSCLAEEKQRLLAYLEQEDVEFLMEDTGDLLTESTEGVVRVRDIVAGMKSFSHSDTTDQEELDLNDTVSKTLALASGQLKTSCALETDLGDLPRLVGNSGRLGQVVMNLVVNASQAVSPDNGKVLIRTFADDNAVTLEVQDNGHGMNEETKNKLFTPFFTTKPVGEGTGLGLSITFGIIEEHGGRVDVESEEGVGTTFSVVLPTKRSAQAATA